MTAIPKAVQGRAHVHGVHAVPVPGPEGRMGAMMPSHDQGAGWMSVQADQEAFWAGMREVIREEVKAVLEELE
jgi:hypothetical protein